ncbi:ferrous iron transport protein B (plasmid) [Pseudoalteromonas sp. T1lg65]|uniref:ferrous iron transport protein B n=1 Tax=Pseudoalteromonas sp. T1lg65 TaxID=2077101 RepID=UPI003F7A65B4
MKIALVGNPNCGKTTLFNRLTGSKQKVGNWPGVTVEKKQGYFILGDQNVELIDLPGLYSLEQIEPSQDEQIACDYLKQNDADVIINIVDAGNLQRNLVLTTQLKELGKPILVVANMMDVASQRGRDIDLVRLSEQLGLAVVPFNGASGFGLKTLLETLQHVVRQPVQKAQVTDLEPQDNHTKAIERHRHVKKLTEGVSTITPMRADTTEVLDKIVLNRWLGVPIFLFMMYLMFTIAVNVGAVFIDFFDIAVGALLIDGMKVLLANIGAPQWVGVLLADGFGAGIQLVATFIPVIAVLYLCLSILEDSGYLSRAAFVIDRLMSSIGLPGNAFVPLIVGFGCNVPAVMAARTMGRESDRLLTIIMAPFMSCGARLTVYALFAAAFFPSNGANIVFALYLLGILVAVGSGFLFRKRVFKTEKLPSFTEMPAYHMPIWRNIFITTWQRLSSFIMRAGKTIVMVVILLSALNSIGLDGSLGNENTEKSLLAKTAQTVTPVFAPIGLNEENWPATVGVVTGMFAKEAIVGTLDALYVGEQAATETFSLMAALQEALQSIADNSRDLLTKLGDPLGLSELEGGSENGAELLTAMAAQFNGQIGAFAYLVFILLYTPCVAVLGAIKRESGGRWMWLVVGWTTSIAYMMATIVYQASQLVVNPLTASLWILAMLVIGLLWWMGLSRLGDKLSQPPTYQIHLS